MAEHGGAKPFTPQAVITIPRVSQVAFTSDENLLVIAAEEGGGLAVYETEALLQGHHEPAFQLATNGVSVRALVPNPAPEFAHLCAIVLTGGQLLLANLKERQLVTGSQGQVFRQDVSCLSWSSKGKQMVAGLQDGSAAQYDHKGEVKAQIPCPSSVAPPVPITAMYWLANDDFLAVHTAQQDQPLDSKVSVIHREKGTGALTTQTLPTDPTGPMNPRCPSHHFMARLRSFPPSLDDLIILASSAGIDVGVIARSTAPLNNDMQADQTTNAYVMASIANDSRRAATPMASNGSGDSSPIGMVIDLTAKENVRQPIPSDAIQESATPLPALMMLDLEGRLITWWIVYTDSITQKTAYPGLVNASSQPTSAPSTNFANNSTSQATPSFGSSTFGATPQAPAFGATSTSGFGGSSALGQSSSPWGSTPTAKPTTTFGSSSFGQPAFGSASAIKPASATPAFGAASGIAAKTSVWGSSPQTAGTTFGQPSAPASSTPAASGFAQFGSGTSAFGAAAANKAPAASPFSGFASNNSTSSPFTAANNPTQSKSSPFAAFASTPAQPLFGAAAKSDKPTFGTPSNTNTSIFGAKTEQQDAFSPEANMTDETAAPAEASKSEQPSSLFGTFKLGSTFAQNKDKKDDSSTKETSKTEAGSSLFGNNFGSALKDAAETPATPIKEEPQTPTSELSSISPLKAEMSNPAEDAPLPPDFASTPAHPAPSASEPTEAPLPPDFVASSSKAAEDAPLPPDFTSVQKASPAEDLPLAGSPPIDLGGTSSTGEHDEDESLEEHDEDESLPPDGREDWEDSEADQDRESLRSDDDEFDDTVIAANQSETSIGSGVPKNGRSSTTPAGFPKGPVFAPPIKESPRSPSPIRDTTTPAPASRARKVLPGTEKLTRRSASTVKAEMSQKRAHRKRSPSPVANLDDLEDERVRNLLASEIVPSKDLEPFVAHQDYINQVDQRGIGAQIENVYRDVNSMIDTLGLNARSLQAFMDGQDKFSKAGTRERSDLEDEEDWCLVEFNDLDKIVDTIGDELDAEDSTNVQQRLQDIGKLQTESAKIRARASDVRKQLAVRTDPEKRAAQRNAAMDSATEAQQAQIRAVLAKTQKLLQETEDALSTLRADLASNTQTTSLAGGKSAVPTMEAVTKTILKMTAMVEEKSGDVDVLEAQMRRLHRDLAELSLGGEGDADSHVNDSLSNSMLRSSISLQSNQSFRRSTRASQALPLSRSMNVLSTSRSRLSGIPAEATGLSGMLGSRAMVSPSLDKRHPLGKSMSVMSLMSPLSASLLGQSIVGPPSAFGTGSPQRAMADVTLAEVEEYTAKREHRLRVLGALKDVVEKRGPRVVTAS